jgi:hypothetical protein
MVRLTCSCFNVYIIGWGEMGNLRSNTNQSKLWWEQRKLSSCDLRYYGTMCLSMFSCTLQCIYEWTSSEWTISRVLVGPECFYSCTCLSNRCLSSTDPVQVHSTLHTCNDYNTGFLFSLAVVWQSVHGLMQRSTGAPLACCKCSPGLACRHHQKLQCICCPHPGPQAACPRVLSQARRSPTACCMSKECVSCSIRGGLRLLGMRTLRAWWSGMDLSVPVHDVRGVHAHNTAVLEVVALYAQPGTVKYPSMVWQPLCGIQVDCRRCPVSCRDPLVYVLPAVRSTCSTVLLRGVANVIDAR